MNDIIAFYSKTPPNKFSLDHPTICYTEENRSCSDTLQVFINIDDQGIITEWSFEGITSIITTATASVFGESIVWLHIQEVLKMDYHTIVNLIGEEVSPRRKKSAVYGLVSTKNAIHTYLKDGKKESILDLIDDEEA